MSESLSSPPAAPDDPMASYRPVSAAAVIAILVGLTSVVAFWHPGLAAVPVAGIFVSAFALWRISRSGGTLVGKPLALVGLIFSIACLCAAPTYFGLQILTSRREAQRVADEWFEMLRRGDVEQAMDQIPGVSLLLTEPDPSAKGGIAIAAPERSRELFLERMPAAKWVVDHPDAEFHFTGVHEYRRGRRNESITLHYDASAGSTASEPEARQIRIGLSRRVAGLGATGTWYVDGARFVDATQAAAVPPP